jgi:hypothetical protein
MSVIANIAGNATVQDSITNYGPNIVLTLLNSANLSAYSYLTGETISTSATPITFPFGVTKVQFAYVRNTGQSSLTVTWTPQGGGSNPVVTLTPSGKPGTPGGAIMFVEPDLTLGISALSLQAITSSTSADIIIAG